MRIPRAKIGANPSWRVNAAVWALFPNWNEQNFFDTSLERGCIPIIRCYRFPRENRGRGGGLLINAIYARIEAARERNVAVCIEGGGFSCAEFLLARAERAPNKTLISVFDYTQTDRSSTGPVYCSCRTGNNDVAGSIIVDQNRSTLASGIGFN